MENKESEMMLLVREMKQKCSEKQKNMTPSQIDSDENRVIEWLKTTRKTPIRTMSTSTPQIRHAK